MIEEKQNNMPFFDMKNAYDLFDKLLYDYNVLSKNETTYNYMNFIFTSRHLEDWILKDILLRLFDYNSIDFSNFSFRTSCYMVEVESKMIDLKLVCNKILKDYKIIFCNLSATMK